MYPVGMGVPAVGGILYSLRNEGNLKLSQKLIHTRVYGQMTVVSMVVRTCCLGYHSDDSPYLFAFFDVFQV